MLENKPQAVPVLEAGCHCRAVRCRVEVHRAEVILCNCSICTMKGFRHLLVEGAHFELVRGEAVLSTYRFNTGAAQHTFCSICGVHPFYIPRSNPNGFSVNVNCLDDPYALAWHERAFDGRHWEESISTL